MTYWCAVQTHVRSEDKAAFHLRRQGYDVFLPKHLKRRKHARRVDWVPAPLFPPLPALLAAAGEPAVADGADDRDDDGRPPAGLRRRRRLGWPG